MFSEDFLKELEQLKTKVVELSKDCTYDQFETLALINKTFDKQIKEYKKKLE